DANADGAQGMRPQTGDVPSADNHKKSNGFSQNADGADGAGANSATSSPSADPVPSDYDAVLEELAAQGHADPWAGLDIPLSLQRRSLLRCDHCGQLGATGQYNWPHRPDGITLHSSCEGPWWDSERGQQ